MSHRVAALAIAVLALFGLTACTGSPAVPSTAPSSTSGSQNIDEPGDEGQSKADACGLIQQSIQEATEGLESVSTADPAAVVEAMRSAAEKLAQSAPQITNDEVAALVPSLQDIFTEVAEVMEAVVTGDATRVDDLSQLVAQFRQTSEAFREVCAP